MDLFVGFLLMYSSNATKLQKGLNEGCTFLWNQCNCRIIVPIGGQHFSSQNLSWF